LFICLTLLIGACEMPVLPVRASAPTRTAAALELCGNFNTLGVIVTLDASDDPDGDATANLEYRPSGEASYRQGFPLTLRDAWETVWLPQPVLLGSDDDMALVVEAVRKIQAQAKELI
jgi:hypothetical protein